MRCNSHIWNCLQRFACPQTCTCKGILQQNARVASSPPVLQGWPAGMAGQVPIFVSGSAGQSSFCWTRSYADPLHISAGTGGWVKQNETYFMHMTHTWACPVACFYFSVYSRCSCFQQERTRRLAGRPGGSAVAPEGHGSAGLVATRHFEREVQCFASSTTCEDGSSYLR